MKELEEFLEKLIAERDGDCSNLDERLSSKELAKVWSKKTVDFLKDNLKLYLSVDPCENIDGYDITADVFLGRKLLAHDTDCI